MTEINKKEELAHLKAKAATLGIQHHPSIGIDKLRAKINSKMEEKAPEKPVEAQIPQDLPIAPVAVINSGAVAPRAPQRETRAQKAMRLRKQAAELIRIRVSNHNPNMKEHEGAYYMAGNSMVGMFKKYVPFDNDEGWHVPRIVLNQMQERKCQLFYTVRDKYGNKIRKGKIVKELNIEILPPLTLDELKDLARKQAMSNNIDD